MTREDAMSALMAVLSNITSFKTIGRRFQFWDQTPNQPALFVHHIADEYQRTRTGMPAKVVMECQAWIYDNSGQAVTAIPETNLHNLIDSIEVALAPPLGFPAQTLGGIVTHCWIEGRIDIHPGDAGPQAIAVMTIKILIPSFGG
jgi:hypothetical protein